MQDPRSHTAQENQMRRQHDSTGTFCRHLGRFTIHSPLGAVPAADEPRRCHRDGDFDCCRRAGDRQGGGFPEDRVSLGHGIPARRHHVFHREVQGLVCTAALRQNNCAARCGWHHRLREREGRPVLRRPSWRAGRRSRPAIRQQPLRLPVLQLEGREPHLRRLQQHRHADEDGRLVVLCVRHRRDHQRHRIQTPQVEPSIWRAGRAQRRPSALQPG